MAVKRAKTKRQSSAAKAPSRAAKDNNKVTKLSTARKKLASKGPAPAKKKAAVKSTTALSQSRWCGR